jgi:group II intron reverse transcriptase/maturase
MLSARTGDKLRAISEVARKGRRVKDLRRLMNHPDIWMQAYLNIQGNKGALTRGTEKTTMDGYSPERAANLVELIRERRYKPNPVRRVNIPTKVAGKMRPLGIPSADDKQVQEVVRMILERIYEPLFKDSSHGFSPKRSCHTALRSMQKGWTGTKWFIDIDIKGYFNNIDHEILMKLLEKRIEDSQFLDLIRDMLKAGYVEDWQYHKTYSGTPQGGIVSPILANVYLHEFDEFMEQKKQEFDQGKARRQTTEWLNTTFYKTYYRKRIEALKGDSTQTHLIQRYEEKLRELTQKQQRLDASDPLDPEYRRLFYVRYADDVRHITRCQIPFTERRGSEEKTSGSTTYLEAKAEGDNSMSLKRRVSEGVYATAPQDPCAMVRATLPKPQLPAMEAYIPCPQRLLAGSPRYVGKVVAGGTFRVVSDAE